MKNKSIIITGGTGYLGSSLINYWQGHGPEDLDITVVDRTVKKNRIKNSEQIKFIQADLGSVQLNNFNSGIFIHTSYLKDLNMEKEFLASLDPNLYLVYYSSAAVYGNVLDLSYIEALRAGLNYQEKISVNSPLSPINDYGLYKIDMENFIRERFPKHLILRIANPYGNEPDIRGVYKIFESQINSGLTTININADFPKQIVRDFIHVDDLSKKITELLQREAQGVCNLGTGIGKTLESLVLALNKDIQINYSGHNKNEIMYSVLKT